MRQRVYENRLTAKLNLKYYRYLRSRYIRRDLSIRIFLALSSSSAVATLAIWSQFPVLWQTLTLMTAVVAVAAPFLDYPRLIGDLGDLYGRTLRMEDSFDKLWDKLEADEVVSADDYTGAAAEVAPIKEAEWRIPVDRKLLALCRQEVLSDLNANIQAPGE